MGWGRAGRGGAGRGGAINRCSFLTSKGWEDVKKWLPPCVMLRDESRTCMMTNSSATRMIGGGIQCRSCSSPEILVGRVPVLRFPPSLPAGARRAWRPHGTSGAHSRWARRRRSLRPSCTGRSSIPWATPARWVGTGWSFSQRFAGLVWQSNSKSDTSSANKPGCPQ